MNNKMNTDATHAEKIIGDRNYLSIQYQNGTGLQAEDFSDIIDGLCWMLISYAEEGYERPGFTKHVYWATNLISGAKNSLMKKMEKDFHERPY